MSSSKSLSSRKSKIIREVVCARHIDIYSSENEKYFDKKFLAHLREQCSSEFFLKILSCIGDEMLIINSSGKIVFANDMAIKGFGYSRNEFIGKSITSFLCPRISLKKWHNERFLPLKKKRAPRTEIFDRMSKKSIVQTLEVTSTYTQLEKDGVMVVLSRDVTEQIALQKCISLSESKYRVLAESAADGIVLIKRDGKIAYANPSVARILNRKLSDIIGDSFEHYVAQTSLKKALRIFNKVRGQQKTVTDSINVVDSSSHEITLDFTASPVQGSENDGKFLVVFRDVTIRKQLERLVIETEKMEALRTLISGTVREIHLPLKGIGQSAQRLVAKYHDRDFEYIGHKEYKTIMRSLNSISSQIDYCCDTTSKLINLNKRKIGIKEEGCDVNNVIREAVKLLRHHMEALGVNLNLRLSAKLPKVCLGFLETNQVIMNIISNAIQSIDKNGKIVIRTCFDRKKEMVKIDFSDNGIGIPRDVLPRIFDPFFTTKQRGVDKNAGLGLSIVYSILHSCHGDIDIRSSLRKGTTVSIWVPLSVKKRNSK